LRDTTVDTIDFGFNEDKSFRLKRAVEVVEGGPAHRAGLRNGMEVVSIRGPSRFSNVFIWPPRPTTLVVRENGQERSITFPAEHKPMTLRLFTSNRVH
jgi:predicted metalloprotease with PDZ domain